MSGGGRYPRLNELKRMNAIAKRASDVSDSDRETKRNGRRFETFQGCKQVFLQQFLKQKFGVHIPPISHRTRLCRLTFARFQTSKTSVLANRCVYAMKMFTNKHLECRTKR